MVKVNNEDKVNNGANDVVLVSLLLTLTYFTPCSCVSIVNFEQVNDDWKLTIVAKNLHHRCLTYSKYAPENIKIFKMKLRWRKSS